MDLERLVQNPIRSIIDSNNPTVSKVDADVCTMELVHCANAIFKDPLAVFFDLWRDNVMACTIAYPLERAFDFWKVDDWWMIHENGL